MRAYLEPKFDSRKSFHNKAVIEEVEPYWSWLLYSYETPVIRLIRNQDDQRPEFEVTILPGWDHSATTLRHVKEFLRQHGFKAETKAQIERDYS